MQQVHDGLIFPIETPSDKELRGRFKDKVVFKWSSTDKTVPTRNQRKRKRKSQRRARRVAA